MWSATTPNGIKMIGTQNSEIPSVSISISIKGGGLYAVNNPAKAGLAGIVARMMNEDTKTTLQSNLTPSWINWVVTSAYLQAAKKCSSVFRH
jgi:predicted Zn-dependent peptidase